MRFMGKKSQISIFMVIGIVLLILASFLIYIQKYAIERQSELGMRESEIFESDINALQGYLQSVAESSAEKALIAWSNASGVVNYPESGLFFEECDINGRKQNLTYLYKDGTSYFDGDLDDGLEKARLRQNLSAWAIAYFIRSVDPGVFEEKGMALQEGSLPSANISVEFNEYGTTMFTVTPVLVVLKGGLTARFGSMLVEKNVSALLIEDEIPKAVEWVRNNPGSSFGLYSVANPQKINVCGSDVQSVCGNVVGGGDDSAYLASVVLDESLGSTDKLRFDFLVDVAVSGCSG